MEQGGEIEAAELLALHFGRPDHRFYLRERARVTGASAGTTQRELRALLRVGLVRSERRGRQIFFEANQRSPIFAARRTLLEQTMGAPDLLRAALAPLADRLLFAGIYGSLAQGTLGPDSDIDLLVIGDVEFAEVTDLLAPVEERMGRPANPSVYTVEQFRTAAQQRRHFPRTVLGRPVLPLIGDLPRDASAVAAKRLAPTRTGGGGRGRPAPRGRRPKPR